MVLESFLGETLLKNNGSEIKTSELSTEKGGVIGIYFSDDLSRDREFTPKLARIYNGIKDAGKDFEIVFLSLDDNNDECKEYHQEQPWLAIPYDDDENKDALIEKYQVYNTPTLILLEADTGNTITTEGSSVLIKFGASGFPFTEKRLVEAKKEAKENKKAALKELANLKFLGALGTMDEPGKELDIYEVCRTSEALALAFMDRSEFQGGSCVLPKLLDIQKKIGKEKLSVIVIPLMKDGEAIPEESLTKMKGVPLIPRGDQAQEVVNQLKPIIMYIDAPQVLMIDAKDESSIKVITEKAEHSIYHQGEGAFPWSDEASKAFEERKVAITAQLEMKNLEFFTPSENCHIVDKEGAEVSLVTLQSKEIVGIYFGGQWCGACGALTLELVELYNDCKQQEKSFEVVFVSSDENQEAFDNYYKKMPWYALKYEDRIIKEALEDLFDVMTYPTFILVKGDGEMVVDYYGGIGRMVIEMGVEYFPWSAAELERVELEYEEHKARKLVEVKEKEEKCYAEQAETGRIVIRRHIGEIDRVKVEADHVVTFEDFGTVVAPSAVVSSGEKAWYEVTFKEVFGVSQMGWATSDFSASDKVTEFGVGDCASSWGFDSQRVNKLHGGESSWGKAFTSNEDHVLGVAADMVNGKLLFGLNGDWGEPMGVAFENLDVNLGLFPALTAQGMKVFVNFGDCDMKFGPPDDSFEKLANVVAKPDEIVQSFLRQSLGEGLYCTTL